jgi:hypothetical protein
LSPVESLIHGGSNKLTHHDDPVAAAQEAVKRAFARLGTAPHEPSAEQRANGEPVTVVPEKRLGVPKLVAVMQEVGPNICCAREATTTDNPNTELALAA